MARPFRIGKPDLHRSVSAGFGLVLGLILNSAPALGQPGRQEPDSFLNQQRRIEQEIQDKLDDVLPPANRTALEYGGWYSFYLFMFDDGIESSRTFRRNDLQVWTRLTLDRGAHEIFARGRLSFIDFNAGDSYDRNDDDWEGPNLERGYYQFDLRRAMSAYAGKNLDYNLKFKIGRDLVTFGTGYALSTPLDHVQLQAQAAGFELTGIVGRTVGSADDFDRTRPIHRTRRAFFGTQVRYLNFDRHRPFVYVLWQQDHNSDRPTLPLLQDYTYDSFYVGLGSEGELARNLRYSTEWVWEAGRNFGDRRFAKRNRIQAWAFDAELEYLFEAPTQPTASVEYMFASGDADRRFSPTDTLGGNRGDFRDTGFNAFGWRDTGLALAPVLSNMHIWRAGATCVPLQGKTWCRRLELGTDAYLFWKHHRSAAISDPTSTISSGYVGWEMDFYANWEITHDLAWTTRYGIFFPGKAFDDRTTRTFFLMGMTWSF